MQYEPSERASLRSCDGPVALSRAHVVAALITSSGGKGSLQKDHWAIYFGSLFSAGGRLVPNPTYQGFLLVRDLRD